MGLFSRKPKVRLDEFCRGFYDTHILHPPEVAGTNVPLAYCKVVKRNVAELEPKFAVVDLELLLSELTIIKFEVFGLAWLHRQGDRRAAEQSEFTRCYLMEESRTDIWEAMQPYNKASARSSRLRQSPEAATGRAYLVFVNEMRMNCFDEWEKLGFDLLSVGRAANRVCTNVAWEKSLTAGYLAGTLCERLGCEVNLEAQAMLMAVIHGFYDGVAQSLKSVAIHG